MKFMAWETPYIIVRTNEQGKALIVHTGQKLKDTRYWLQYIALPGDAILKTTEHPKYDGQGGAPSYYAHLKSRGDIQHDEAAWKAQVTPEGGSLVLPSSQEDVFEEAAVEKEVKSDKPVTEIIEAGNSADKKFSTQDLATILRNRSPRYEIVLTDAPKWIDWESALTLMSREVFVVGVDPSAEWPLTITFDPAQAGGDTIAHDDKMQFVVRQKNS